MNGHNTQVHYFALFTCCSSTNCDIDRANVSATLQVRLLNFNIWSNMQNVFRIFISHYIQSETANETVQIEIYQYFLIC